MSDTGLLKQVIQVHCREIRSIKDVARYTNYSSETLRRDFVRSEHITLSAYIVRVRVDMAKRLLQTTDKYCQEICTEVGFSRADVGARAFRRITGATMREFRIRGRREGNGGITAVASSSAGSIPLKSTRKVNR